jgi:16S rRNA (uracil1498-N3)-methyltransferase
VTRRRWIADEVSGNRALLTGSHAEHLSRVLRACVGQEFDIVAGGVVRQGRIIQVDSDRVEFELGDEIAVPATSNVTLLLSVFKFDRMEWAVEKCTELGIYRIVPVIAQRTEAHLAAAAPRRRERWQRIARQASEQSRRSAPLQIAEPMKLKDAIRLTGELRIVLSESEKELALADALSGSGDVLLANGPEGGWTERETELFREDGWVPASLGRTILRAETAAIAAASIVMALQDTTPVVRA